MEHEGYHLIRRLGTGGSGTVWLATDPLGGRVAVKMLHPGLAATEQARARLIREATTVNSINSAQVAHVLDVEADQTQPFVVSDFIDGPTLAESLASGPLPPAQVARLAEVLFEVLDQVHAAHVIHRDVKPSNVIMSATGPVLIDFGIAVGQGDERLTATGLVSGTVGFTAPELLRGDPSSSVTDWWGWAATVLNAATGRPPFGPGQAALIRTTAGQPDVAGLPAAVAQVLTAALAPDPDVRPLPEAVCHVLNNPAAWSDAATSGAVSGKTDEDSTFELAIDVLQQQDSATVAAQLPTEFIHSAQLGRDKTDEDSATEFLATAGKTLVEPTRTLPVTGTAAVTPHPFSQQSHSRTFGPQASGFQTEYLATPEYPDTAQYSKTEVYPHVQTGFVHTYYPNQAQNGSGSVNPAQTSYTQIPCVPYSGAANDGTGENLDQTPWMQMPYVEHLPRPATWVIVTVMAVVASAPVFAGTMGGAVAVVVLVLFSTLGAGNRWIERRRVRFGRQHRSDVFWAVLALPWHVITGALGIAVSLIPGVLGGIAAWVALRQLIGPSTAMPQFRWLMDYLITGSDLAGWSSNPLWQPLIWGVLVIALLVTAVMPTSRPLRRGIQLSAQTLLGPWWARLIFMLLVVGVLVASWDVTTSSGLG